MNFAPFGTMKYSIFDIPTYPKLYIICVIVYLFVPLSSLQSYDLPCLTFILVHSYVVLATDLGYLPDDQLLDDRN